jgi:hypothetical protein
VQSGSKGGWLDVTRTVRGAPAIDGAFQIAAIPRLTSALATVRGLGGFCRPNPFPGTAYGTSSGSWNVPDFAQALSAPLLAAERRNLPTLIAHALALVTVFQIGETATTPRARDPPTATGLPLKRRIVALFHGRIEGA